jgi:hypothetical protein
MLYIVYMRRFGDVGYLTWEWYLVSLLIVNLGLKSFIDSALRRFYDSHSSLSEVLLYSKWISQISLVIL